MHSVNICQSHTYTVSQKNGTDLACYNSDFHQLILTIFDREVAERTATGLPTSPN